MSAASGSVLDGVPVDQPEMARALELQQRAAQVGFDWDSLPPVLAKVHEELAELETEIGRDAGLERLRDELGDLLFAVANLARKLGLDPVMALRGTNAKFRRRFAVIEQQLTHQGKRPQDVSLAEMDVLWELAKHNEQTR